jgi:outer membrane immunogenic protein
MKKQSILGVLIFSAIIIQAQAPEKQERFFLNVGGGVSLLDYVPVYMGVDYMFMRNLSLNLEYTFAKEHDSDIYLSVTQAYMIGMHYHFNDLLKLNKRWDLYAGPVFELESGRKLSTTPKIGRNTFYRRTWGANVGARYFLTDRLALNLKIGYGNIWSVGTVGISVKF